MYVFLNVYTQESMVVFFEFSRTTLSMVFGRADFRCPNAPPEQPKTDEDLLNYLVSQICRSIVMQDHCYFVVCRRVLFCKRFGY